MERGDGEVQGVSPSWNARAREDSQTHLLSGVAGHTPDHGGSGPAVGLQPGNHGGGRRNRLQPTGVPYEVPGEFQAVPLEGLQQRPTFRLVPCQRRAVPLLSCLSGGKGDTRTETQAHEGDGGIDLGFREGVGTVVASHYLGGHCPRVLLPQHGMGAGDGCLPRQERPDGITEIQHASHPAIFGSPLRRRKVDHHVLVVGVSMNDTHPQVGYERAQAFHKPLGHLPEKLPVPGIAHHLEIGPNHLPGGLEIRLQLPVLGRVGKPLQRPVHSPEESTQTPQKS